MPLSKEKIERELKQEELTEMHADLLQHAKDLVKLSRDVMGEYYDAWDDRDKVYRGERSLDKDDKKEKEKGGNAKFIVPLTYSQIQTFIAFSFSLFYQRKHFFELEGTGEEDHRAAKIGEALLEQNLDYNVFSQKLYQFLLDIGRFSIGVLKHTWHTETEQVWVKRQPTPLEIMGQVFSGSFGQPIEELTDQTKFKGNKIVNISPYRFYPDPRVPLTRFQEGEFCASEDEISRTTLKRGEYNGEFYGINHIADMTDAMYNKRGNARFPHFKTKEKVLSPRKEHKPGSFIVTEVVVDIIPSEYTFEDGTKLGDSDAPEKWLIVYANDNRIIKLQPFGYLHNKFPYSVAQFSPDQHRMINETISDMIGQMQSVIDWFVNSHITNVRKHISNRLVVDPSHVEWQDVKNLSPVIRLKPDASNLGVDRFVKQLNVSDVTRGHIEDINVLIRFVQMTTSISDNMMGQFHTGRRSASEARNIAQASGSRMKVVDKLIYDTALVDLAQMMLSNLRDGLDEQTFVTVIGEDFPDWEAYDNFVLDNGKVKVGIDRTNLAGRFDFTVFEGTLPSEKQQQAESLEQILLALLKAPDGFAILTQMLGYDPNLLFKESLELRGTKHPERFKLSVRRQQEYQQKQMEYMQMKQMEKQQGTGMPGAGAGAPGAGAPVDQIPQPTLQPQPTQPNGPTGPAQPSF